MSAVLPLVPVPSSVRPTGGEKSTGLGLSIVRRIVAAHGGSVWVESTVGQGSTFSFSLPLQAAQTKAAGQDARPQAGV